MPQDRFLYQPNNESDNLNFYIQHIADLKFII